MIKFPSIESFRHTCKTVKMQAQYQGQDENDKAIMDPFAEMPVIEFTGTVKLHGTNAGVAYDGENLWAQSRKNVITPEKDNAGFAFFVESNRDLFIEMMRKIRFEIGVESGDTTVIYGEWCGKGIQKGVAITELDKMFVVFKVKVATVNKEDSNYWVDLDSCKFQPIWGHFNDVRVFFIDQFPIYKMEIDFSKPEESQNKLIDLTMAVEAECPVGKHFGVSGIGEGIVWSAGEHIFKVKGEKHSVTKVKKLASVDIEKVNSIKEFVEYACTENRLKQGIDEVFTLQGIEPSKKDIRLFISWINRDVVKEEMDTLASNGLTPKDVGSALSRKAVKWLMENYEV